MANNFKTPNALRAFFNVRSYKKPEELEPDGGNISMLLSCGANQPTWCGGFEQQYTDKQGNNKWSVKVKIGATCRFYDSAKQPIPRPAHADLAQGRYEVIVAGSILPKDPAKPLKASGLWASHIMLNKIEVSPFDENDNFANATQYAPQAAAAPIAQQPVQQPATIPPTKAADELPF